MLQAELDAVMEDRYQMQVWNGKCERGLGWSVQAELDAVMEDRYQMQVWMDT